MTREEAALWLTGFFLPPLKGYGENLRAESADKFLKALLALTAAPADEEKAREVDYDAAIAAAKVIRDWANEAIGVDKDGRLVAQYDECGDPEGWPTRLRDAVIAFDAALAGEK